MWLHYQHWKRIEAFKWIANLEQSSGALHVLSVLQRLLASRLLLRSSLPVFCVWESARVTWSRCRRAGTVQAGGDGTTRTRSKDYIHVYVRAIQCADLILLLIISTGTCYTKSAATCRECSSNVARAPSFGDSVRLFLLLYLTFSLL